MLVEKSSDTSSEYMGWSLLVDLCFDIDLHAYEGDAASSCFRHSQSFPLCG